MISTDFIWAIVILVVLLAAAALAARVLTRIAAVGPRDDRQMATYGRRLVGFVVVAVVIGFAVGLWPYQWEYHSFKPVAGTVAEVHSRLFAEDQGTTQSYAIRLTSGKTYRCDDTRCSAVKAGDTIALRCIREWEYAAEDGFRCRFVRHVPADR